MTILKDKDNISNIPTVVRMGSSDPLKSFFLYRPCRPLPPAIDLRVRILTKSSLPLHTILHLWSAKNAKQIMARMYYQLRLLELYWRSEQQFYILSECPDYSGCSLYCRYSLIRTNNWAKRGNRSSRNERDISHTNYGIFGHDWRK